MDSFELDKKYEINGLSFKVINFNDNKVGRILNKFPNEKELLEYTDICSTLATANEFMKSLSFASSLEQSQINDLYNDLFEKAKDARINLSKWIKIMKTQYNLPRSADFFGNFFTFDLGDF